MAEVDDVLIKKVEARAWEINDKTDETKLYWGEGTLER